MLADDIRVELWRKFIFICAQAGMTATTRLSIAKSVRPTSSGGYVAGSWRRSPPVAQSEGIKRPDGIIDEWLDFAHDLDPELYLSLYYDLTHDNRLELNALYDFTVRHANDVDIDVPMNEAVNAILRPWTDRAA